MVWRDDRLHARGDHLLRTQAILVRGWKGQFGAAAFDEGGQLGFVCRSKAVDELRKRALVVAHAERTVRDWLGAAAAAVGFNHNVKWLLVEAAYVDLSFLAENDRLNTVSGNVIPGHLYLGDHLAVEPKIKQCVIEILLAGG